MKNVPNYEIEGSPSQVAHLVEKEKVMKEILLEMRNMVDGVEIIGIKEACRLTGYSKNTIYQYVNKNKIPYHKPVHGGRKLIFFREEIESWLKGRKPETTDEL